MDAWENVVRGHRRRRSISSADIFSWSADSRFRFFVACVGSKAVLGRQGRLRVKMDITLWEGDGDLLTTETGENALAQLVLRQVLIHNGVDPADEGGMTRKVFMLEHACPSRAVVTRLTDGLPRRRGE
jgi:hypothetical protein